jgi:hypothetical protein
VPDAAVEVPRLDDRRRIPRRPVAGDLIAGLTVARVLVPQSLAYAKLAGMPPERGLYAAIIPLIIVAGPAARHAGNASSLLSSRWGVDVHARACDGQRHSGPSTADRVAQSAASLCHPPC